MSDSANKVLKKILEDIELSDGAYERATERYESIGNWLHREESSCVVHEPHVFPSGSFRLGLANKPVDDKDAYDLDMTCELKQGISKETYPQEKLKSLVGKELELYRKAKGIQKPLDEKRRCWTLEYSDHLNFHMDIVPCIPASTTRQTQLRDSMVISSRLDKDLAGTVASLAVSITDNEEPGYTVISNHWPVSNPEGFAKWFESRMRLATMFLDERMAVLKANIDDLPHYRWKTPLQQAIQILKQHRDVMFSNNPDTKPISVILTTLASRVYQGESDLAAALQRILNDMDQYVRRDAPRVPNPVNPEEDFADKWGSPKYAHLKLEENFIRWLTQARADFKAILSDNDPSLIVDAARHGLDVNLNKSDIAAILGVAITGAPAIRKIQADDSQPWFNKKRRK